jgi:large subunit ribosomal protein L31
MKPGIHPQYRLTNITCGCGSTFQTRSTKKDMHVDVCAACHPFFTGEQRLIDTAGQVERFQRRLQQAKRS